MKILDLGCGKNKTKGAIGVDWDKDSAADITHDLNVYPYPFADNEFDHIICSHIVEHVNDVKRLMEEIHRIAKPNAIVEGITPHFSNPCAYYDPTHRHYFGVRFLDFFAKSEMPAKTFFFRVVNGVLECYYPIPQFSSLFEFRIVKRELYFPRCFRLLGISVFANRFPEIYEFYLSGIFRARDIIFRLQVLK